MKKMMIIMVALLIALTACQTEVFLETPQPGEPTHAITVQGSSEFEVAPDIAKIRFRIETQDKDAKLAQSQNSKIANAVMAALKKAGVRASDIETTGYRIEKVQDWDQNTRKYVEKGYRTSNSVVVITKDLERVGTFLDAAVQAGANNVESLNFELSEAKQEDAKIEALRQAAQNAKVKAEALASGAGVRLGKVRNINENSFGIMPYARMDMVAMEASMESAPTPVSPQSVRVNAQVSVSYEVA